MKASKTTELATETGCKPDTTVYYRITRRLKLSGLIRTTAHLDIRKIRIIGLSFFCRPITISSSLGNQSNQNDALRSQRVSFDMFRSISVHFHSNLNFGMQRIFPFIVMPFNNYDDFQSADESDNEKADKKGEIEKKYKCIIYVRNLDSDMDDLELEDLFEEYGEIRSATIMVDEDACKSRGFGFVRFETMEAADEAISKANGKIVNGRKLLVKRYMHWTEREKRSEEQTKAYTNLYIGNFGTDMTENELKHLFVIFGDIKSLKIVTDDNGVSKGFGFINFANHDSAIKAVESMNGKKWKDKLLIVNRAQKKEERRIGLKKMVEERKRRQRGRNLFIQYLPRNITEQELRQSFEQFGKIESLKITVIKFSARAFICYESEEAALMAKDQMDRKKITPKSKRIRVKLANMK